MQGSDVRDTGGNHRTSVHDVASPGLVAEGDGAAELLLATILFGP